MVTWYVASGGHAFMEEVHSSYWRADRAITSPGLTGFSVGVTPANSSACRSEANELAKCLALGIGVTLDWHIVGFEQSLVAFLCTKSEFVLRSG